MMTCFGIFGEVLRLLDLVRMNWMREVEAFVLDGKILAFVAGMTGFLACLASLLL